MGKAFTESLEFTRSTREQFQKGLPLLQALERSADFEKAVGEEVLTLLHSKIRVFVGSDGPEIKKIFEAISADEERHEEMLSLAVTRLKEKQKAVG